MDKSKQILLIILAVAAILVAVGVGYILKGNAACSAAKDDFNSKFSDLERIYSADPFPSAKNVKAMESSVSTLVNIRSALEKHLVSCNIPKSEKSPSQFVQELSATVRALRSKAPIVEGSRVVADGFAFGFEGYVSGATLPKEGDVARLGQQLNIIRNIVDEMYAAGVSSIITVQREEFEGSSASAAATAAEDDEESSRTTRRRGRRRSAADEDSDDAAKPRRRAIAGGVSTELFSTQRFAFDFETRQNPLIVLMNSLAKSRMFVVITDVRIAKQKSDVTLPEDNSAAANAAKNPAPFSDSKIVVEKAESAPVVDSTPPSKRLMSGPKIDPPLRVYLELDVYNFNAEIPVGESAAETKTGEAK